MAYNPTHHVAALRLIDRYVLCVGPAPAYSLPGNGANANGDVTTNANGGGWTTATTNGANGGSGSVTDSEGNGVR